MMTIDFRLKSRLTLYIIKKIFKASHSAQSANKHRNLEIQDFDENTVDSRWTIKRPKKVQVFEFFELTKVDDSYSFL